MPDSAVVARPVVGTLGNTAQILRLVVGNQEIRTSQEHPFFVKDRGWRPGKLIQPGDELLTEAGTWTKCKAAVLTADFAAVYNVEIEEHHTYFVGNAADGSAVWAHNACAGRTGKQARLRQLAGDPNVSRTIRGWINNEMRHIKFGNRTSIRLPFSNTINKQCVPIGADRRH